MRLRRNRSDVSEFPADMICSGFEVMGGFTVAARDNNSAIFAPTIARDSYGVLICVIAGSILSQCLLRSDSLTERAHLRPSCSQVVEHA